MWDCAGIAFYIWVRDTFIRQMCLVRWVRDSFICEIWDCAGIAFCIWLVIWVRDTFKYDIYVSSGTTFCMWVRDTFIFQIWLTTWVRDTFIRKIWVRETFIVISLILKYYLNSNLTYEYVTNSCNQAYLGYECVTNLYLRYKCVTNPHAECDTHTNSYLTYEWVTNSSDESYLTHECITNLCAEWGTHIAMSHPHKDTFHIWMSHELISHTWMSLRYVTRSYVRCAFVTHPYARCEFVTHSYGQFSPLWPLICMRFVTYSYMLRKALCCSVLQCVAVCCSVLQCRTYEGYAPNSCVIRDLFIHAAPSPVLQCVAVWCSMLQCVAVSYIWMICPKFICDSWLFHTCCAEPCVAVCCSVLQCVAVCCSVLQRRTYEWYAPNSYVIRDLFMHASAWLNRMIRDWFNKCEFVTHLYGQSPPTWPPSRMWFVTYSYVRYEFVTHFSFSFVSSWLIHMVNSLRLDTQFICDLWVFIR